jgi:8-oxo-dGTP diphosphatase
MKDMALIPAAIGIVLNEDQTKILLVRRKDTPVWVLPGGGIEPDESPEEAVIREVNEETGYNIRIERKCSEYYPINRLAAFTSVFICNIIDGESCLSSETSAIEFFPSKNLPESLFEIHREWVEEALSSKVFILKPLSQVTYYAAFKYFIRHPLRVIRYLWTRCTKD